MVNPFFLLVQGGSPPSIVITNVDLPLDRCDSKRLDARSDQDGQPKLERKRAFPSFTLVLGKLFIRAHPAFFKRRAAWVTHAQVIKPPVPQTDERCRHHGRLDAVRDQRLVGVQNPMRVLTMRAKWFPAVSFPL